MKKLFSIIAILTMAMTAWADEVQWTNVATAQEFYDAIKNSRSNNTYYANVRLTADIDLSELDYPHFIYTFEGRVTGENPGGQDYAIRYSNAENTYSLFQTIRNTTISHLIIENFNKTEMTNNSNSKYFSALADKAYNSTLSHVTLRNSHLNCDKNETGGIVGYAAEGTTFEYCTVDSNCQIEGNGMVGGILGNGNNVNIRYCVNEALVHALGDNVGGIVGRSDNNTTVINCLNTGNLKGQNNSGGIVGYFKGNVSNSVNTGSIDSNGSGDIYTDRGGIVGKIDGNNSIVDNCLNFGNVSGTNATGDAIAGTVSDNATNGAHNYYYCQYKGEHADNDANYTDEGTLYRYEKMQSGELACKTAGYYQSIDNGVLKVCFPVPIATAGTVYSNILCDGTQSYSNRYKSTGSHTGVADMYGYCTTCGKQIGSLATEIHITDASGLLTLANLVNSGTDFSSRTIYLDNDLDMSGIDNYPTIGKGFTTPFKGTFNGQGHRIKNLNMNSRNDLVGLFGCVSGTTIIKNLIIDKTCRFTRTSGYGAAAIVTCMARPEVDLSDPINLTLDACGNEANVKGDINAAGLVGAVYNTETYGNATVTITNCYNTGNIKGSGVENGESAAFIAYGNNNTTVKNCYNTGTVVGNWEGLSLVRVKNESTVTLRNIYNLEGVAVQNSEDCKTVTADQVRSGDLCTRLRSGENATVWSQNLETDTYPAFGTAGLHYDRTMSNQWGTICLPYAIKNGDDYDLYIIEGVSGETLTLTKVGNDGLAAGTPALIRRNTNATGINIPYTDGSFVTTPVAGSSANGLTLTGSFEVKDITSENGYIISNNKFWNIQSIKGENNVYNAPFRAYLAGTISGGSSNAKILTIGWDDEEDITAVEAINMLTEGEAEYYDINGRKLNDLLQGINIVKRGNKTYKVIVK